MSDFTERLTTGEAHEKRVAEALGYRHWEATRTGQGVLPENTRWALRQARSKFRYFPDLIAAREGEVVAIDAKTRLHSTRTRHYAVSRECVDAGLQIVAAFNLPVFYVFGNFGVLCPTEVRSYGFLGPRGDLGGAYYLVDERLAHDFDAVFGYPEAEAA